MISSISEAIEKIEERKEGIPFEAIKYLYESPPSKKISKKIIYALKHALDDTYYDKKDDYFYDIPLWYAIVAENHLSKKLIKLVIKLYISDYTYGDFMNEQGEYLIGKLAQKFPDLVIKKVKKAIDKMIDKNLDLPYLYLFDVFYYADKEKNKKWLLETLGKENLYWKGTLAYIIAELRIKEAIPILEDLIEKEQNPFEKGDLEESLEILKSEKSEAERPYCEKRENWEEHYSGMEECFYKEEDDDEEIEDHVEALDYYENLFSKLAPNKVKKIGRNDPCPCGSGKKYKKCCIGKGLEYGSYDDNINGPRRSDGRD